VAIVRLGQAQAVEFFAPGSLLPVANKCSFVLRGVRARAVLDLPTRAVHWTKEYDLEKAHSAHTGNDQWFEVTGCPEGQIDAATSTNMGFAFESLLDTRDNLVHRIDFGRQLAVGETLSVRITFVTRGLGQEEKLIKIGSTTPFHSAFLFRYDQGYSVQCDALSLTVDILGGRVADAWPRAIITEQGTQRVVFRKTPVRPYEVVTPLVHVQRGSEALSRVIQATATFLLGVSASLVAQLVFS
jgi:hypothetical protein